MYINEQNKVGGAAKLLQALEIAKRQHGNDFELEVAQSAVDADIEQLFKHSTDTDYTEGKEYPMMRFMGIKVRIVPDVQAHRVEPIKS